MYRFGSQQLNVHAPTCSRTRSRGFQSCRAEAISVCVGRNHRNRGRTPLFAHDVDVELGPVGRAGARGDGTSVYFHDPDGSLYELISSC